MSRLPPGWLSTASGLILVGSASNHAVYVFEGSNTHASRTIETTFPAAGIAVDPLWNYLYVANPTIDVVRVFNLANDALVPGWGFTGVDAPYDVALQLPTGYFYVSQWAGNTGTIVKAFARGENTFDPELSLSGVTGPWGVAVSPANGAVYVTDAPNDVHVYPSVTSSVTGVDPPTGPVTGGTTVSINGKNLGAVAQVTVNGVVAEQIGPAFRTTIPVKVPAATRAGAVTVQVTWAGNIAGKAEAFTYTAVAPDRATGVTGVPGNGQVTVSWTAPVFDGGKAITGYVVTPSPSGAPCSTTGTTCVVAGLTNGQPYQFTVTSTNAGGAVEHLGAFGGSDAGDLGVAEGQGEEGLVQASSSWCPNTGELREEVEQGERGRGDQNLHVMGRRAPRRSCARSSCRRRARSRSA